MLSKLSSISGFNWHRYHGRVFDRYLELFDAALASNGTSELGNLLALSAYWNSNPGLRQRLTDVANKAAFIEGLSLPEKRVNPIAAEIYAQIECFAIDYAENFLIDY